MKRPWLAHTKHEPAYPPSLLVAFYPLRQVDVKKQTEESVVMLHLYLEYRRRSQAIGTRPAASIPCAGMAFFERWPGARISRGGGKRCKRSWGAVPLADERSHPVSSG
jgi:hypothetical protein